MNAQITLLIRSNKILGTVTILKDGIRGTTTDVREVLPYAIKINARGIISCHNHPISNSQPNEFNLVINSKIKESVNVMDIQLLDHLIIIPESKY